MHLSAFSIIEPEEKFWLYYPSWLNVRESSLYKKALKATHAHNWFFKRFGVNEDSYIRENIRKPSCKSYLDAMEKASDAAVRKLSVREKRSVMTSRTALLYVDSWGEQSLFENNLSALYASHIDVLPKNIVKKFSIRHFTSKIRGERLSFIQAMQLAQDYLDGNIFDYVMICAAYRAIPMLVFAAEEKKPHRKSEAIRSNLSVERVGCFIFSQKAGGNKIECGNYFFSENKADLQDKVFTGVSDVLYCGRPGEMNQEMQGASLVSLGDIYGDSGCLNPALAWEYMRRNIKSDGKVRALVCDNFGGYIYFDTWY